MKIETKYDIGQEVWFMEDNHAQSGTVTGLRFSYKRRLVLQDRRRM